MAENFLENLYKQQPELKDKSLNEIKRQLDQLTMVMKDKEREEEERKARELEETIAAVRVQYDEEFERRKDSCIADFKWFVREEEHTSELKSLMHNSYAVCCWKQKTTHKHS